MKIRQKVKIRDEFTCRLCGDRKGKFYPETSAIVEDIHAHHIIPKAQGGPDLMENLMTLCDLCHGVVTPQWWKWFGIDKIENGKQKMETLKLRFDNYMNSIRIEEKKNLQTGKNLS